MPRPRRVLIPGGIYHVYTRGVLRGDVFFDEFDRRYFLKLLALCVERHEIIVRCFCLMTNHIHLQVVTPKPNLSAAMHFLFGAFASFVNRRYERTGHLFESRFYSPIVEPGLTELALSRYIHLNPVAAKLVDRPGEYSWSSYRYFLLQGDRPDWLVPGHLLGGYGADCQEASRLYASYVEEPERNPAEGSEMFERQVAIGGEAFCRQFERPKKSVTSEPERASHSPASERALIVRLVARELRIPEDQLRSRSRRGRDTKVAAAYLLRTLTNWPQRQIGEVLGGRSERTVARLLLDAAEQLRTVEAFRERMRECVESLASVVGQGT
jgi:REP-associated tyrosine transposase